MGASRATWIADIFISYSREDRAKAATLARALEDRSWKVWWDREIALGLPFDEVIERELRASRCVVVLWTAHSIASQWVRREARAAVKDKKLVPIVVGDVELPLEFSDLQNAELATWSELERQAEFEKVVRRIEELVPAAEGAAVPPRSPTERPDRSPAPRSPDPAPRRSHLSMRSVAMAAVAVAALSAGAVLLTRRSPAGSETKPALPTGVPLVVAGPPAAGPEMSIPKDHGSPSELAAADAPPPPELRPRYERPAARKRTNFHSTIDSVGSFTPTEFEIAGLDLARDFTVVFNVKSTRQGGSTRYGIAWNYQPGDFELFTLHSIGGGYYSIGTGKSRTSEPWTHFSSGKIAINGERGFDALEMSKIGSALTFSVDGHEVWSTRDYRLRSKRFAFWVADTSDAVMSSYAVKQ